MPLGNFEREVLRVLAGLFGLLALVAVAGFLTFEVTSFRATYGNSGELRRRTFRSGTGSTHLTATRRRSGERIPRWGRRT